MLDFSHDVYGSFPLMLGLVALATFVLLARAFRSLATAAEGSGDEPRLARRRLRRDDLDVAARSRQPGRMGNPRHRRDHHVGARDGLAFLFGLSMDYEVFILARMRESYDRRGDTRAAVIEGIGRTGRLVTSAALILVLSFLAMSTAPETDVRSSPPVSAQASSSTPR